MNANASPRANTRATNGATAVPRTARTQRCNAAIVSVPAAETSRDTSALSASAAAAVASSSPADTNAAHCGDAAHTHSASVTLAAMQCTADEMAEDDTFAAISKCTLEAISMPIAAVCTSSIHSSRLPLTAPAASETFAASNDADVRGDAEAAVAADASNSHHHCAARVNRTVAAVEWCADDAGSRSMLPLSMPPLNRDLHAVIAACHDGGSVDESVSALIALGNIEDADGADDDGACESCDAAAAF